MNIINQAYTQTPTMPTEPDLISRLIAITDPNLDRSKMTPKERAFFEQLDGMAAHLSKLRAQGKQMSDLSDEEWAELIPMAQEGMRAIMQVMREKGNGEGKIGEVEEHIDEWNRLLESQRMSIVAEGKTEREGEVKKEGDARDAPKGGVRGGERGSNSPA